MNTTAPNCFRLFAATAALVIAQPALAAGPIVDDPTQRTFEDFEPEPPAGQWVLGLGAGYVPRYEGSKEHVIRAVPIVAYQYGGFTASAAGLRYNFSSNDSLRFGPRLSLRGGRHESDADHLNGLGDIPFSVGAGLFARLSLSAFSLQADVSQGIGGAGGAQAELGVVHGSSLGTGDRLLLGVSLEWVDSTYAQAFFGVDAAQSVRSGLPAYSADAGIKSYIVNATWVHAFSPSWFSTLGLNAKQLVGAAADSPITEERTTIGVIGGVGYRF